MKRFFALLLVLSMCSVASCSQAQTPKTVQTETVADETDNGTMVETVVENESVSPVLPSDYTSVKLDLTAQTELYKTFGRIYLNEKGLNVDFGGNGFEFEAECGGDVTLHYNAGMYTYLQVFVDGQPGLRITTASGDDKESVIAEDLESGHHTIRVIRDTDVNKNGNILGLTGVSFMGKEETVKAPDQKALYIEFVGDSITAGKYTQMQYGSGDAIHKATSSYAYLTADALEADFSFVARGGCGYFRVNTCPKTMNQLYQYYNIFSKVYTEKYTPTRQADVVVLALGTNDGPTNVKENYEKGIVPFATFEEALKDQIRLIREMHGSDVKIVLIYNMMSSSWEEEFMKVSQEENTYILKTTKNREGGNNHPSVEGHKTIANELVTYMRDVVLK